MNFSIENIQKLVLHDYVGHAHEAFGQVGKDAVVAILNTVKLFYQKCPPEQLKGPLTIVIGIEATPNSPATDSLGALALVHTHSELADKVLTTATGHHSFIEICSDNTFRVISLQNDADISTLAVNAVLYRFEKGTESILAKHHQDFIPKISPQLLSNFAAPTLSSLEEALNRYDRDFVRESQCSTLATVWEGGVDGPRLVLVNKPESLMRNSLVQALRLLTRDTSVRPEQNTDETKPVDIRVEWFGSGASALIEVKWIGRSISIPRRTRPEPAYLDYDNSRAREGAKQLADYMDREVRHSGASAPRGYLVVFDARRKGVNGPGDQLTKTDALHFENAQLGFDPDYAQARNDFAPPFRFYMKPRESHFLAA